MLYKVKAIVLGGIDIKEADKIVTLYSRERGKIRAVAKGVRKTKSKFGSSLEPFCLSNFVIYSKYSGLHHAQPSGLLDIIKDAEIEFSHRSLRQDIFCFAYASFVSELVSSMTEEGPHGDPRIFYLLKEFLSIDPKEPQNLKKRFLNYSAYSFSFRFFDVLGYSPFIEECAICGSRDIVSKKKMGFSVNEGGIICEPCKDKKSGMPQFSFSSLQYFRKLLVSDACFLKNLKITEPQEREIKKVLQDYFDFYLKRELRSMRFLESLMEA